MKERRIGKIKSIKINEDSNDIELVVAISDPKFKKQIIRDLNLSGNLKIDGENFIFIPSENDDA